MNLFKIRTICIICLAASSILLSGCGSDVKDPYTLIQDSINQALNNGNWSKAKSLAVEAVELDPDNLDAKVMYAFALEQSGEQAEAVKNLKIVTEKDPKCFIAQLTLGRILYDMQDYEGAYDALSNAYSLKPSNPDALLMFAQCSSKLLAQNTDKLLIKLSQTEPYKGKPVIFNELAVYYAETGNLKLAVENLVKAYKLSSENPTIVLNLAVLCDKYLKQPVKGKFFYKKFISLTNNNPAYNQQRENVSKRLKVI